MATFYLPRHGLGQLIRVDDGHENATWVYEYDRGGNITSKSKYALGVTSGTPVESKTFTYGNSNWKDQLTAVNGVGIAYDEIGNPTSDGTWTYTWEKGRQLKSMSNGSTTASFKYNSDGLRVQKTVGSVVTNYTLHGKNIVHMTQGSNSLHFFYDASNKPAIVDFNGTKYAYVHNLQGDIVAILDSNGTAVIQYKYDAWGRIISKTGSLASTLGTVQPFRYRGYVFDEETGVYYLRSRYYDTLRCRFVNPDALVTRNQYAYCDNSLVNAADPDGYKPDYGQRTRIHNRVCQEVLNQMAKLNIFGFTGSGMKVVTENGNVGFVDIVLTTSLVIEVKRCTYSAAKTLVQLTDYRNSIWVGHNIRTIKRNQNPQEILIFDYFYDEQENVWIYYQEIPGGVVLYDYGTEDKKDKYRKRVVEKARAYEQAVQSTVSDVKNACVAFGCALGGGLAMGLCYKAFDDHYSLSLWGY